MFIEITNLNTIWNRGGFWKKLSRGCKNKWGGAWKDEMSPIKTSNLKHSLLNSTEEETITVEEK